MSNKYLSISLIALLVLGSVLLVFLLQTDNETNPDSTVNQAVVATEAETAVDPNEDTPEQLAQNDKQRHDDVNKLMDVWGDYIIETEGSSHTDHNEMLIILESINLKYYSLDNLYFNGVPLGEANDESNDAHWASLLQTTEAVSLTGASTHGSIPAHFIVPDIDERDNLYLWRLMSCTADGSPTIGPIPSGWYGWALQYALEGNRATACRSFSESGICWVNWRDTQGIIADKKRQLVSDDECQL